MSLSTASTNASSEPAPSASVWRRSKPIGGAGGELGAGSLRQVGGGAGWLGEPRESRDMVRLNVGLDHRDDLRALRVRGRDVVVDQVRMRVDDGELPRRLAAKQIGGAGGLVVEELAEVHWGLTSYQEFY